MSIQQQRIGREISLRAPRSDIEHDAENQTTEIITSNMALLKAHVADLLKLDHISFMSADSKVNN